MNNKRHSSSVTEEECFVYPAVTLKYGEASKEPASSAGRVSREASLTSPSSQIAQQPQQSTLLPTKSTAQSTSAAVSMPMSGAKMQSAINTSTPNVSLPQYTQSPVQQQQYHQHQPQPQHNSPSSLQQKKSSSASVKSIIKNSSQFSTTTEASLGGRGIGGRMLGRLSDDEDDDDDEDNLLSVTRKIKPPRSPASVTSKHRRANEKSRSDTNLSKDRIGSCSSIQNIRKYSVVDPEAIMANSDQKSAGSTKMRFKCMYLVLVGVSYLCIILCFPFSLFICIKVVAEYERAVIFRLGKLYSGGPKGPGLYFTIPCLDSVRKVDLRTVTFDVPPQEVLTKDSVTVAVDAVVYYRIYNPIASVNNVEDCDRSTRLLAATTLRNVLGTKDLAEILSERDSISNMMQLTLDEATHPWGVKVERVEVKDVRLPIQLQRAMAAEAEATREARAKVIAAQGEQKSAKALKEASDVINQSPIALQLRYLQTLSAISAEKNSTIIFPFPVNLLHHIVSPSKSSTH